MLQTPWWNVATLVEPLRCPELVIALALGRAQGCTSQPLHYQRCVTRLLTGDDTQIPPEYYQLYSPYLYFFSWPAWTSCAETIDHQDRHIQQAQPLHASTTRSHTSSDPDRRRRPGRILRPERPPWPFSQARRPSFYNCSQRPAFSSMGFRTNIHPTPIKSQLSSARRHIEAQ